MKMLTHLLERAMQSMKFERHEMVPCPMKSSNRLRKALVDLNLEARSYHIHICDISLVMCVDRSSCGMTKARYTFTIMVKIRN